MVNKCCAPNCRSNYDGGEKVSAFKFPKDETLRSKWILNIKREKTFIPSKNSVVSRKKVY